MVSVCKEVQKSGLHFDLMIGIVRKLQIQITGLDY
jgi:hypothetical protein